MPEAPPAPESPNAPLALVLVVSVADVDAAVSLTLAFAVEELVFELTVLFCEYVVSVETDAPVTAGDVAVVVVAVP